MDDIPPEIEQYTDQSLSKIHHALRAGRRRLVIGLLAYRVIATEPDSSCTTELSSSSSAPSEPIVEVRQLAREIVMIEEQVPEDHATGDQYHNVYTSLIQTHLPELDNVGVISYDSDRKRVAPDQNLGAVAIVASISSPVARLLFHSALTSRGALDSLGSTTD